MNGQSAVSKSCCRAVIIGSLFMAAAGFGAFGGPRPAGAALLYNVEVLDKAAIRQLTDEQLIDKYIDIMIELEASEVFHKTSGFSNIKEYDRFKDILRYRTDLLLEIRKRKLEVPQITP